MMYIYVLIYVWQRFDVDNILIVDYGLMLGKRCWFLPKSWYLKKSLFSVTSDFPHVENSCEMNPSHMVFMIFNFGLCI